MSSRDWDKELAKIDKQLASLSDDELLAPTPPATGMPRGAGATAVRATAGAAALPAAAAPGAGRARWWTWSKLAVTATAAVAIWFWPWPARCGLPLAGLVAAGAGVSLLGLWTAVGTWRHRMGLAHTLSLLAIVSGLVLGAREVLPRVGYAHSTFDRPDRWSCQAAPPAPATDAPASSAPIPAPTRRGAPPPSVL